MFFMLNYPRILLFPSRDLLGNSACSFMFTRQTDVFGTVSKRCHHCAAIHNIGFNVDVLWVLVDLYPCSAEVAY